MKEETKRIARAVYKAYGWNAQSGMMVEEMAELTQAIQKLKRTAFNVETSGGLHENYKEELGDVFFVLMQLIQDAGEKDIMRRVQEKSEKMAGRREVAAWLIGEPEPTEETHQFTQGGRVVGNDSAPSPILPGEFVMPVKPAQQFSPILEAMRCGASLPEIINLIHQAKDL